MTATGGVDSSNVPVGGVGSAGSSVAGGPGLNDMMSGWGGGGGGAGWIRVNTSSGAATINAGATLSPAKGSGCYSEGTIGG